MTRQGFPPEAPFLRPFRRVEPSPEPESPGRVSILERSESRAAVEAFRGGGDPSVEQRPAMLSASVADYDIGMDEPMKLTTTTQVSVDGVMQGPGGPDGEEGAGVEQWTYPYARLGRLLA